MVWGRAVRTVISYTLHAFYLVSQGKPLLLLLDEKYSYLSADYTDRFFNFLKQLAKEKGGVVVLVTHDQRFFEFADKTYSVRDGEVCELKNG